MRELVALRFGKEEEECKFCMMDRAFNKNLLECQHKPFPILTEMRHANICVGRNTRFKIFA